MATFYREQVAALHLALGSAEGPDLAEAGECLRSLVGKIVLTPENGKLALDVHGDLAGILAIARARGPLRGAIDTTSPPKPRNDRQFSLPKHNGRPRGGRCGPNSTASKVGCGGRI